MGDSPIQSDGWSRVDIALLEAIERIREQTQLTVVFLVSDGDVERTAELQYVYFEPLANIVVGISSVEPRISITADGPLWHRDSLGPTFERLTDDANECLRRQDVGDALIAIAQRACELTREPPLCPGDDYEQPTPEANRAVTLVPNRMRTIFSLLVLVLGGMIGLAFAFVVLDSWKQPEGDKTFAWAGNGHAVGLLVAGLSVAWFARMVWTRVDVLRGRPSTPLGAWLTNERAGWIMFFAGGVPLTINLVSSVATTEWTTDVPFLVLLPLRVAEWFETIVFAVFFLLAPQIGWAADRDSEE